jgi:hypothetical protein
MLTVMLAPFNDDFDKMLEGQMRMKKYYFGPKNCEILTI